MGRDPTASSSAAAVSPSSSATTPASQHSPWQSPAPYLFGGLAAMLGLIALSLLALACSYWKLSGSLSGGESSSSDDDDPDRRRAIRGGDAEKGAAAGKPGPADGDTWREHVVVVMAGDERPTFLATPASGARAGNNAAGSGSRGGGSEAEQGRCVECGARARPDGSEDAALSRGEHSAGDDGGSVTSGT